MPWKKLADAPASLKGAGLDLSQANIWGRFFDGFREAGADQGDAATRAWLAFKRTYRKTGDGWVIKNKTATTESCGLIFLSVNEVQNPWRLEPCQYGSRRSLGNTVFHVQRQLGEDIEVWGIYEGHVLWRDQDGFAISPYTGSGQSLRISEDATPVEEDTARALCHEMAEREQGRHVMPLTEVGRRNSATDEDRLRKVISLGMDLLGDDAADELVKGRRKGAPKTNKGKAKKQVDAEESRLRSASHLERSAATGYTPTAERGRALEGLSDEGPAPSFDLHPDTSETAAAQAVAALRGTSPEETADTDRGLQLETAETMSDISSLYAYAMDEIGVSDFYTLRAAYPNTDDFHEALRDHCGPVDESFNGKKAPLFKKKKHEQIQDDTRARFEEAKKKAVGKA